ncbi:phasin family protein [Rhodoblastus sp.]|uniref:phasin family protein n=1 Tax=Rhodoblastus sp. TaxID=1962975 RepID=UPI0025D3951F|nr:phasin family protein [Rhodoblastus sp.]
MASAQPMEQARADDLTSVFGGFSALSLKAQAIAVELAKISEENFGAGAKAAERFRNAKSMQDITALQTDLIKESIATLNEHYRKIAEIAASTPQEVARSCAEMFSAVTHAGGEIVNRASDATRQVSDQVADAAHRTAEAGRRGAEEMRRGAEPARHS